MKKNKDKFNSFLPIVLFVILALISTIVIYAFTSNSVSYKYLGKIKDMGFKEYRNKTMPCYGDMCFSKDDMIITLETGYYNFDLYTPMSSNYKSDKYLRVIYNIFGDDSVTELAPFIDKFISNYNTNNTLDYSIDLENYDLRMEFYDGYIVYNIRDDVDRSYTKSFPSSGNIEYYDNGKDATKFMFDTYTIGSNSLKELIPFLEYKNNEYLDSESKLNTSFSIAQNNGGAINTNYNYSDSFNSYTLYINNNVYSNNYNFKEEYIEEYFIENYKDIISKDIEFFNNTYHYDISKSVILNFFDKYLNNDLDIDHQNIDSGKINVRIFSTDDGEVNIYYKVISDEQA